MDDARQTELRGKLKRLLDEYGVGLGYDWDATGDSVVAIKEKPTRWSHDILDVDEIMFVEAYVAPAPPLPLTEEHKVARAQAARDRLEQHFHDVDQKRREMGVLQAEQPGELLVTQRSGGLRRLAADIAPPVLVLAFFALMMKAAGLW